VKAIMVMFDSLNRRMLPPYGCDWTHAPNFSRLAERAVTFDNAWARSMPCMPARREIHTSSRYGSGFSPRVRVPGTVRSGAEGNHQLPYKVSRIVIVTATSASL
jgi:hypothetical protein